MVSMLFSFLGKPINNTPTLMIVALTSQLTIQYVICAVHTCTLVILMVHFTCISKKPLHVYGINKPINNTIHYL